MTVPAASSPRSSTAREPRRSSPATTRGWRSWSAPGSGGTSWWCRGPTSPTLTDLPREYRGRDFGAVQRRRARRRGRTREPTERRRDEQQGLAERDTPPPTWSRASQGWPGGVFFGRASPTRATRSGTTSRLEFGRQFDVPELPEFELPPRPRRWGGKKTSTASGPHQGGAALSAGDAEGVEALAGARLDGCGGWAGTFPDLHGPWPGRRAAGRLVAPGDDQEVAGAPGTSRAARHRVELISSAGAPRYVDQPHVRALPAGSRRRSSRSRDRRTGSRPSRRRDRLPALAGRPALKGPIKVALLDQTLLAGVGNIQASESLFRAGIGRDVRHARSAGGSQAARRRHPQIDRLTLKPSPWTAPTAAAPTSATSRRVRPPIRFWSTAARETLPRKGIEGRDRPHRPGRPRDLLLPALPD